MPRNKEPNSGSGHEDGLRFKDLLENVKPLHSDHKNQATHQSPKPNPTPRETLKDEQRVLEESLEISSELDDLQPGDSLSFCRSGIQKSVFKKLRKGQWKWACEI